MFVNGFLFVAIWLTVYAAAMIYKGELVPFGEIWKTLFVTGVLAMGITSAVLILLGSVIWIAITVETIVLVMFATTFFLKWWYRMFGKRRAEKVSKAS